MLKTVRPWLLIFILLAFGLRFGGLDRADLWVDEAFSLWMARHETRALIAVARELDHHPPFYYLLLAVWTQWTGETEFGLRSLSAWMGVLAVPLFFQAAKRLSGSSGNWGNKVGLVAALFLVCSPFHVAYAQEARMYALNALGAALALSAAAVFFARLLDESGGGRGQAVGRRHIVGIVVGQAMVMWSHNTGVLLFGVTLNAAFVLVWVLRRRGGFEPTSSRAEALPRLARQWLWAQVGAFGLWLLWLPGLIRQAQNVGTRFWVQPPDAERVWSVFQAHSFGHLPATVDPGWGMALNGLFFCAVCMGVFVLWRRPARLFLLILLWLGGPVLSLVAGLYRPIFLESTLIATTFGYYILLACCVGLASEASRLGNWFRHVGSRIAFLLLAGMLAGLWGHYTHPQREAWRAVVATVINQARPADLVLFHASWLELPFLYYAQGSLADGLPQMGGVPVDLFDRGELEPEMLAEDVGPLMARIEPYDRVWLVYGHGWYTDPDGLVPAALEETMTPAYYRGLPGVEVFRFERARVTRQKRVTRARRVLKMFECGPGLAGVPVLMGK